MAELSRTTENSYFDGNFWQRLGWLILARLVTVVTLGIAYPAAVCMLLRWECCHTVINGRRLKFTGSGAQLFGKYILWWLLTIVTFGIFGIFLGLNMKKWTVKHTVYADDNTSAVSRFTGGIGGYLGFRLLAALLTVCTFGIGAAWAKRMIVNWEIKHTYISGTHLIFTGRGGQLFGKYLLWGLLSVVTFTVFSWFIPIKFLKWKYKHTGAEPVDKVPGEKKAGVGAILAVIGVGLAVILIIGAAVFLFMPQADMSFNQNIGFEQGVVAGNEQLPDVIPNGDGTNEPELAETTAAPVDSDIIDSAALVGTWIGCSKTLYQLTDPAGDPATGMTCLHWSLDADGKFTSYYLGYANYNGTFIELYNPVKHIGTWELSDNTLTIHNETIDFPADEPDEPDNTVETYTVRLENGNLVIDDHPDCSTMLQNATADDVYAYVTAASVSQTDAGELPGTWIVIGTPSENTEPVDDVHSHFTSGGYYTFYDDGTFELETIQFAKHKQDSWYHMGGGEKSYAGTYHLDGTTLKLHYTTTYEVYWDDAAQSQAARPVDIDGSEEIPFLTNPDGMTAEVFESDWFGPLCVFQKASTEIPIDDILTILKEQY